MIYDVNYFIAKFEAIPEHFWYSGNFNNPDGTKHCALGFCVRKITVGSGHGMICEGECLSSIFRAHGYSVIFVNDHHYAGSRENLGPKQRILAALYDFKLVEEAIRDEKKTIELEDVNVEAVQAILSEPVLEAML